MLRRKRHSGHKGAIEQKGLGKDLKKPIRQSDGTLLIPFQQAKRVDFYPLVIV